MPCPISQAEESQRGGAESLQAPLFKLRGAKVRQTALGQTHSSRAPVFSSNQALKFLLEELHQGDGA